MSNWSRVTIEGRTYQVVTSGLVSKFVYDTEEKRTVWRQVRQIVLEEITEREEKN